MQRLKRTKEEVKQEMTKNFAITVGVVALFMLIIAPPTPPTLPSFPPTLHGTPRPAATPRTPRPAATPQTPQPAATPRTPMPAATPGV